MFVWFPLFGFPCLHIQFCLQHTRTSVAAWRCCQLLQKEISRFARVRVGSIQQRLQFVCCEFDLDILSLVKLARVASPFYVNAGSCSDQQDNNESQAAPASDLSARCVRFGKVSMWEYDGPNSPHFTRFSTSCVFKDHLATSPDDACIWFLFRNSVICQNSF